jgi:hypothetical protein
MKSRNDQKYWVVKRRKRGGRKPRRRIGVALHAGPLATPAGELPTFAMHAPSSRANTISAAISLGLHGGILLALLLIAWLAPPELIEEFLPLELVNEPLPDSTPAPAPRVIAESSGAFAPAPQAFAPQIVNPSVVARAAPVVPGQALEMASVSSVAAPTAVARRLIQAEHVSAVRSVAAATTSPVAVAPMAPALRGPVEVQAPSGPSVGPRAVASGGSTQGLGAPGALGTGSSVREGIASDRDVAGSASGPRLASVNTRVGDSLWGAGPGGTGTGLGVSFEECTARPEVQSYMEKVRQRMISRWVIPPKVASNQSVTLQFKLDAAGSATHVRLVRTDDDNLGTSAVNALRSASPFPPMTDRVRCLARDRLLATFMNPLAGSS